MTGPRALGALVCALVVTWLMGTAVWADSKSRKPNKGKDAHAETDSEGADGKETEGAGSQGKTSKTKVLTFTGLDLEGKLKTPQLLYFLNRVRVELDSSTPAKRSFMKELERTADDKGL